MSKPKLTGWYPGEVKPVRKGVYMQMCGGSGSRVGYQYWDGSIWGSWDSSIEGARITKALPATWHYQNDKWRGLTEPSK